MINASSRLPFVLIISSFVAILLFSTLIINANYPFLDFYSSSNNNLNPINLNNLDNNNYQLNFSTFFGGNDTETSRITTTDPFGNIYVIGLTESLDFPMVNAYNSTHGGSFDVFLVKFSPSGSLVWSTFLGGTGADNGKGIAIDSQNNILISGDTVSSNFPIKNAYQSTHADDTYYDTFVAKFDTSGSLVWSTFLGGTHLETNNGIAVDSQDNVLVFGETFSSNFPTKNAYNSTNGGLSDNYLAKFDSSGSLLWSTYFGGSNDENSEALAVDSMDDIVITGYTDSNNFPTKNGYNSTYGGGDYDGFVSKFASKGTLLWSTYLGGDDFDRLNTLVIDSQNSIIVTGTTLSNDFPSKNAIQSDKGNVSDAIISKFDTNGVLSLSTFWGGDKIDQGFGIGVDSEDNIVVGGATNSSDFPTENPYKESYTGNVYDIFVSKFSKDLSSLHWSTYFGGTDWEFLADLTVTPTNDIVLIGYTVSTDYPTKNAYNNTYGGKIDNFLTKFSLFLDKSQPNLTPATDLSYFEGETGNTITWEVNDPNPGVYNVTKNGTSYITNKSWSNGSIVVDVDGLSLGDHNFTIYVYDSFGNMASDSTFVSVTEKAISTTTSTTSTPTISPNNPLVMINMVPILLIFFLSSSIILRTKRPN